MADTVAVGRRAAPPGGMWNTIKREFADPDRKTAYYMVLPALVVVLAIAVFPVVYGVYVSFTDATVTGPGSWVGFGNYVDMFGDSNFIEALANTGIFTVGSVVLELLLGMAIALGLNRYFVGRGTTRAIALVPWAFPTVISAAMWRLMYQDQVGIMAYFAEKIGIVTEPILSDRGSMMIAAIVVDVWKTTPFMAILILAGLQVIPGDVYEAARVDGATPWQQFTRITLPLVRPALMVALLFRTLDAWRIFDLAWVMSDRQLSTLSTYVFEGVRISQINFAVGDAAAVFVFVTSLLIAVLFIRVLGTKAAG